MSELFLTREQRFNIVQKTAPSILDTYGYQISNIDREHSVIVFFRETPVKFETDKERDDYVTKISSQLYQAYCKEVGGKDATLILSVEVDGPKLEIKVL